MRNCGELGQDGQDRGAGGGELTRAESDDAGEGDNIVAGTCWVWGPPLDERRGGRGGRTVL
jgi:hypothetical protein